MCGVLTLDLALSLGWAHATDEAIAAWPAGALQARGHDWTGVNSGYVTFKSYGSDWGYHYHDLSGWLADMLLFLKPTWVTFEAPVLPKANRKNTTVYTVDRQFGRAAIVEVCCAHRNRKDGYPKKIYASHAQTVRLHFAGHGRASKTQVIDTCRGRGWDPANGDEADALALLDHEAAHYRTQVLARRRAAA